MSVIICTIREEPRLDLILECLKRQTYKWFELIYVDALKDKRSKDFIQKLNNTDFITKHVQDKPWIGMGKQPGIANARNTGVLYSSGEILCVAGDNTYIQNTWIERHVKIVSKDKISISPCYVIPKSLPKGINYAEISKAPSHPIETRVKIGYEYEENGEKKFQYKIFKAPTDCRLPGLPDNKFFGRDPFIEVKIGGWLHGSSFALPISYWLELNGMNEEYDKYGYGFEDCEFGLRLVKAGFKIIMDTANWVISINDDLNTPLCTVFNVTSGHNYDLWISALEGKTSDWVNRKFDLSKMKKEFECSKEK